MILRTAFMITRIYTLTTWIRSFETNKHVAIVLRKITTGTSVIRWNLNSTPGPSRLDSMHISGTTWASQDCGQILQKPLYTFSYTAPLTTPPRLRLWARILLARNHRFLKTVCIISHKLPIVYAPP